MPTEREYPEQLRIRQACTSICLLPRGTLALEYYRTNYITLFSLQGLKKVIPETPENQTPIHLRKSQIYANYQGPQYWTGSGWGHLLYILAFRKWLHGFFFPFARLLYYLLPIIQTIVLEEFKARNLFAELHLNFLIWYDHGLDMLCFWWIISRLGATIRIHTIRLSFVCLR